MTTVTRTKEGSAEICVVGVCTLRLTMVVPVSPLMSTGSMGSEVSLLTWSTGPVIVTKGEGWTSEAVMA